MFGNEDITREILGNVPGWMATVFYVLVAAASILAIAGFFRRLQLHRRGRPDANKSAQLGWGKLFRELLFQKKLRRNPFAGVAHLLTFYGFVILFWGTCLVFLEHDTPLHFFYGRFYQIASLIVDVGGVMFLVGLGMFAWRRHVWQTDPLLRQWWVAALTWLLLAIGISGFLLEATRIAQGLPVFEQWSVVGYSIARLLRSVGLAGDDLLTLHRWLWGLHAVLCIVLFALLPWRFFAHAVYSTLNLLKKSTRPLSQLSTPALTTTPGTAFWHEMSNTDLLQADACTTCGRCVSVCPANAAGKPLQPREVVLAVRAAMDEGPQGSPLSWIKDDTLWSCTTCGGCNHVCPVGIDIYHKIIDLRRARVEGGIVPEAAEQVFEGVASSQNPFGRPNSERMMWARGLDVQTAEEDQPVELLYWIGCAGSFDADGQAVARSMVKILNHLGINYRVLGCSERCTGDPARRLGEEGLFRQQAAANIDLLGRHRVGRILTHCPHCLNMFRNEYPELAAQATWDVVHHTEYLAELMTAGILAPMKLNQEQVTFHDPCYLGRGNGIVEPPRRALERVTSSAPVEMPRHGSESFCCGAGGGAMWVDVPGQDRVENIRAREAVATEASTVVTACPFCRVMLRTGLETVTSEPPKVRDLAELIAESL